MTASSTVSDAAFPVGEGRFSTGETAASFPVEIRLGESGLSIVFRDGQAARHWPYASLTADAPLKPKSKDALLGSSQDPKAHLFLTDLALLKSLSHRAPNLTPRAMRRAHARPWIATTLVVLLAVGAFVFSGVSPASMLAHLLPERARIALGEQAVAAMVGDRHMCTSPAGTKALEVLATRLASDGSFPHFDITVVDWDLMNAFAVPGDRIVLTRGLIDKAGGPDEVAGVLAHEMGHGLKRHPEAAFVRAVGLAAAGEMIMGGTGSSLASIGIVLAQLSYSRANEREADETALALLHSSNISAKGFRRFFDRVLEEEGTTRPEDGSAISHAVALLRSHPPTEERRRMVDAVPDYAATPALKDRDWQALKAICAP